jgi:ABC-type multidrug transport system ATPase subunit
MLPSYDLTEVGERGISLSGGQKQRINICRVIYCNTDIQIFDVRFFLYAGVGSISIVRNQDPLSALDAHVGNAVFRNVLKNSTTGKTRILVTHALHFLPEVDYIYTLVDGKIAEWGTYNELMMNNGAFCKFIEEFGSKEDNTTKRAEHPAGEGAEGKKEQKAGVKGKAMMQEEERNTGSVKLEVYREYLSAGKGMVLVPTLFLSLLLMQGSSVMSSYW